MQNKYYLVATHWPNLNPVDQTNNFINQNVWRNYDSKYLNKVRDIPVGSILAIKSPVAITNNEMKIKCIGRVIENPGTGDKLVVKWLANFITSTFHKGGYWGKVEEVTNKEDIDTIFLKYLTMLN